MIRRPPRSTRKESSAASDVYKRQADGLPTLVVTHQLQVKRRTGKVRRPETDVLPLCHATNLSPYVYQFIQQYSAVASASELTVVVVSYLCDDVMKDWTFLYCVYFIMHFDAFCAFRVVVLASVLPAETPCWRSTTSCGSVSVCLSVCLCLAQVGVLSKLLDGLSCFLPRSLSSTYFTLH